MWIALISVLTGATGWLGAKLLFEPLQEIWKLRIEVQEHLIAYGDLQANAPDAAREEAGKAFHRVGVALAARHLAAWWWVRAFYWHVLGQDIYSAGEGCMGLGLEILHRGYSKPNLGPGVFPMIRGRLRLPTPSPTDATRDLHERMEWPPPVASQTGGYPPGSRPPRLVGQWPRWLRRS